MPELCDRRPVAFLDRDGTINTDRGFVHRIEDWEFVPGAVEAIARLRAAGFVIAVVTNQSGIGRGLFSEESFWALQQHVQRELAARGAAIDAVARCPHTAESMCECRKPGIGMAAVIAEHLGMGIDYAASWTIGDKPSDIAFGQVLGTKTALIRSRYWTDALLQTRPDLIGNNLAELVELIVGNRRD